MSPNVPSWDADGIHIFTMVQAFLGDQALAVAAESGQRPRRLDVVVASPSARRAFEALFPALAAPGPAPARRPPPAPPPPPPRPSAA